MGEAGIKGGDLICVTIERINKISTSMQMIKKMNEKGIYKCNLMSILD